MNSYIINFNKSKLTLLGIASSTTTNMSEGFSGAYCFRSLARQEIH